MKPDDMKIPESLDIAREEGLATVFGEVDLKDAHPNSVVLKVVGEHGRDLTVQASSLGGGRIMVNKLDGIAVDCTCEMPTLIVRNQDRPGHVALVASMLAGKSINIANMHLYRDRRGGDAVMVMEIDKDLPEDCVRWLNQLEGVTKVTYINVADE